MQIVNLLAPLGENSDGIFVESGHNEQTTNSGHVGLDRGEISVKYILKSLRKNLGFFQATHLRQHRAHGITLRWHLLMELVGKATITKIVVAEIVVELVWSSIRHDGKSQGLERVFVRILEEKGRDMIGNCSCIQPRLWKIKMLNSAR